MWQLWPQASRGGGCARVCVGTHEARAVVAEGGLHVSGLLEIVDKTEAQLGADDAGAHEVGGDLLSADEALPAR